MRQNPANPRKRMDPLLLILLLASLSLNVFLGTYIKRLRARASTQPVAVNLVPGVTILPITASDLSGKAATISYSDTDKPTVLYVFSPKCVWCERNTQNLQTLATLKGGSFRFIGLSLDETKLAEYIEAHHFKFQVYKDVTQSSVEMLGLRSTPQTIVVSPEGRVLKNWIGVYGEHSQPDVEGFFGVHLPGLTATTN